MIVHHLHTNFGFTNTVLRWCSSYMTDWTQYVSLSNYCSAFAAVNSAFPQGSELHTFLHILQAIDYHYKFTHSTTHHSLADDLEIHMSALPDKISELLHSMQSCIRDIKAWATANMPTLNEKN